MPVVCLLLSHSHHALFRIAVVGTGDGLHVLVDGHDDLLPLDEVSCGHDAKDIIAFETVEHPDRVVVDQVLTHDGKTQWLPGGFTVGLVGGQYVLAEVTTPRQRDYHLIGVEGFHQVVKLVVELGCTFGGVRVECPQAVTPVHCYLDGSSDLVCVDVSINQ